MSQEPVRQREKLERIRERLAHAQDGWFFAQIADRVAERRKELGLSQADLAHVDDGWFFSQIAGRVAERRKELGLSQAELAELVATTQSAIARLESGGRPPRIDTLLRIAEALDCDLQVELRPR